MKACKIICHAAVNFGVSIYAYVRVRNATATETRRKYLTTTLPSAIHGRRVSLCSALLAAQAPSWRMRF